MFRDINFSLWCDFVERDFLGAGFKTLIDDSVIHGATSNPAIFQKSFCSSPAYREDIEAMRGSDPKAVYEALAIKDITLAADLLLPLYESWRDGFISIEVDPFHCDDTQCTLDEGKRLYDAINRPNVMIKVPATPEGYPAIEALVAAGINVNCTLIFSPEQIQDCLDAIKRGYDKTDKTPSTVLSIFVSRFDRKCDAKLTAKGMEAGRLGIMNAQLGYHMIKEADVPYCRTLFASTGVKGDSYAPSYYVDELLFSDAVNTAPLGTIESFVVSGDKTPKTPLPRSEVEAWLKKADAIVDLKTVYAELIDEGVDAFKKSFTELLTNLKG